MASPATGQAPALARQRKMHAAGFSIIGIIVVFSVATAYLRTDAIQFWEFRSDDIVRLFTQLIVVALVIERSIEVLLTPWRAGGSEKLQAQVKLGKEALLAAPEVAAAPLVEAMGAQIEHRDETRKLAFFTALCIGLVVSMVGVRTLQFLAEPQAFGRLPGAQQVVFKIIDVILTGAMLAGGADGLHKVISVFTSYMDKTTEKNKTS